MSDLLLGGSAVEYITSVHTDMGVAFSKKRGGEFDERPSHCHRQPRGMLTSRRGWSATGTVSRVRMWWKCSTKPYDAL